MTRHPMLRRAMAFVASILLLALAWTGITGSAQQWPQSTTTGQRLQTASQFVYGVFALVSLVTAFRWRPLQRVANVMFVVGAIAAASLAARVWAGATITATVLTGLAALAIAGVIVLMLRTGVGAASPRQAGDRP